MIKIPLSSILLAMTFGFGQIVFCAERNNKDGQGGIAPQVLADVRAGLQEGFLAIARGELTGYEEIQAILIKHPSLKNTPIWDVTEGYNPNDPHNTEDNTPLTFVIKKMSDQNWQMHLGMLDWFLAHGVDVSCVTNAGNNVFHLLAKASHVDADMVKKFVDAYKKQELEGTTKGVSLSSALSTANLHGKYPLEGENVLYMRAPYVEKFLLMLHHGADPNRACGAKVVMWRGPVSYSLRVSNCGQLHWAMQGGSSAGEKDRLQKQVIDHLVKRGADLYQRVVVEGLPNDTQGILSAYRPVTPVDLIKSHREWDSGRKKYTNKPTDLQKWFFQQGYYTTPETMVGAAHAMNDAKILPEIVRLVLGYMAPQSLVAKVMHFSKKKMPIPFFSVVNELDDVFCSRGLCLAHVEKKGSAHRRIGDTQ